MDAAGARVKLGGPVPRRLFTELIAAAGQPVPDDQLTEAVWGADTPARAATTLQVCVSRLRQALGVEARQLLQRTNSGYALRLDPDATDAAQFTRAVYEGRRHLADGRAGTALHVLTGALALWRGEPYADLPTSNLVAAARAQLTELREVAFEERGAARLALGDAARAVSELSAAVTSSPFRERRWALLILGLYRGGRQGDALAALRRVRALLSDELGVDPGAELRELERRVLSHDPRLLLPESTGPAAPAAPTGRGAKACLTGRGGSTGRGGAAGEADRNRTWPLSTFVGRDRELATVASALRERRLVTLVGPGGVGKTRLVVQYVAQRVDSPWLVRLAHVREPAALAQVVTDAVGGPGRPCADLVDALAARPGLLVLDNCEHLVEPVAELVLELLEHCPDLHVLVTSREPLGVDGETCVPVEPLPLRAPDGTDGPAVTMLLDRVTAVRTGWRPTEAERAEAHAVCAALDGLPLALELAAARARVLSLGEISARLDDRFTLLGAVPRGSLSTHATLRAAVGWSVERLPEADRALLHRLWAFDGEFSMEGAEAVRPAATSMIESMATLVARSVVVADTTVTPARYRLLETVRAYCRESDPDPAATREAHARWAREFAARTEVGSRTARPATVSLTPALGRPRLDRARRSLAALDAVTEDMARLRRRFAEVIALAERTGHTGRLPRAHAICQLAMTLLSIQAAGLTNELTAPARADGPDPDWLLGGRRLLGGTGWSNLAAGWSSLYEARTATDPAPRAEQALGSIRLAFSSFQEDGDRPLSLAALHTGASALELVNRADDGLQLKAATGQHAKKLGIPVEHFLRIGTLLDGSSAAPRRRRPADRARPHRAAVRPAPGPGRVTLSWAEMASLLAVGH
ncbi:MAG TPA: BTAD domain-containing putative transcriptional regulator [Pseudonocardia sp.]|nr:BTAD domain-containing putative transcriptional regulator [Pseudonocardia sp.]